MVAHRCHGKTFSLTTKLFLSWQNFFSHGKTFSLMAKLFLSRQNFFSHGKTFFLTAKLSLTRQNFLSHGKTFFLTAKIWSETATNFFGSSHRYNRVSGSRVALVYRIHHSATLHWGPDSGTPFFSNHVLFFLEHPEGQVPEVNLLQYYREL